MPVKTRQLLENERERFSNALAVSSQPDAQSVDHPDLESIFERAKILRESIDERLREYAAELDAEELITLQSQLHEILDQSLAATIKKQVVSSVTRLAELAQRDSLTSLLNRAAFDRILNEEVTRAERYRRELSLALLDLDHFKLVNDRLGHVAGDEALAQVARLLQSSLRQSDRIFRYGGDEFVAICPETPGNAMINALSRLEINLKKYCIEAGLPQHGCDLGVSWGIASFPVDTDSAAELIRIADKRLYECKRDHYKSLSAANSTIVYG